MINLYVIDEGSELEPHTLSIVILIGQSLLAYVTVSILWFGKLAVDAISVIGAPAIPAYSAVLGHYPAKVLFIRLWQLMYMYIHLAVKRKPLTPSPTNEDSECDTEDEIER